MDFGFGVDVTRQRGTAVPDPYSGESTDLNWDDPEEVVYHGCAVWQESSLEPAPVDQRRFQVVTVTKVTVPYDADMEAADRFVVLGKTYQVTGEVERYHHPMTGWEPGAVATGTRIDG